jgi:oligoendopeptidase F
MSFTKTISTVAALASIFGVGLASWKISEDIKNAQTSPLEQKIQELEKQIEEAKKPVEQVAQPQVQEVQQPIILPPVAPPPPPVPTETQP